MTDVQQVTDPIVLHGETPAYDARTNRLHWVDQFGFHGAPVTISSRTPDGNLKGTVNVTFTGAEALEHRLAALKTDEAGRNQDLEQELKDRLPPESVVKFTESRGWTDPSQPLTTTFSVEMPGFATTSGSSSG